MNKVISYIGFAIKSNKILVGQSSLKQAKQHIHLILVCHTASENLKNLAKNLAAKNNCNFLITKPDLSALTHIADVKIVGILDESLAKAILDNKEKIIG